MSYAIRDAIAAASNFPSEAEVAKLKDKFKIKVKHDLLIFEPRIQLEIGEAQFDQGVSILANSLEHMEIPNVGGVLEIVGACIKHKAPEFTFPDAELDEIQLERLNRWANSSNYFIVSSKPLILRKGLATGQDNSSPNGGLKLG